MKEKVSQLETFIAFFGLLVTGLLLGVGMAQGNLFKVIVAMPLAVISTNYSVKIIELIKERGLMK